MIIKSKRHQDRQKTYDFKLADEEAGKLMGDLIDIAGSTAIRNVIIPISTTHKFEDLGEAFWGYKPADEEQIMKEFELLKSGFISRGHFLKTMGFTEGNFE